MQPALAPDLEDVRERARHLRRRAVGRRIVSTTVIAVVLGAAVLVPLRALAPIGDHDRGETSLDPGSPTTTTFSDTEDGITLEAPAGWTFRAGPVPNLIDPQVDLALGSWSFPSGGDCGPNPALEDLPADGVFIWLTEYAESDVTPALRDGFAPSPQEASFAAERVQPECANAQPSYVLEFHVGTRYFELHAAYGSGVDTGAEATVRGIVDSIAVQN